MNPSFPSLVSGTLFILMGGSQLMTQTPPTNTHYVVLTIKMTAHAQLKPKEFCFINTSSMYGQAPKGSVTFTEQGYVLEYVTESGEKICSHFNLGDSPYDGSIAPDFSASIPTQQNGTGYRIYKDGKLLWIEDIVSPKNDVPIQVMELGGGKLRILPANIKNIYLSMDGGLHWESNWRPPLTPDWVYQIYKYDPLKLPKPLIRIDMWQKMRRQSFTYEVGASVAPPLVLNIQLERLDQDSQVSFVYPSLK